MSDFMGGPWWERTMPLGKHGVRYQCETGQSGEMPYEAEPELVFAQKAEVSLCTVRNGASAKSLRGVGLIPTAPTL